MGLRSRFFMRFKKQNKRVLRFSSFSFLFILNAPKRPRAVSPRRGPVAALDHLSPWRISVVFSCAPICTPPGSGSRNKTSKSIAAPVVNNTLPTKKSHTAE